MKTTLLACICTLALASAAPGLAADTPREVVALFCQLDFEGHRLSTEAYRPIEPLISYPAEPGQDTVIGVRGYAIADERIEGDSATVTVRYDIDRSWPEELEEIGRHQSERFVLTRTKGTWRIAEYILWPRVSTVLLCSRYGYCADR